MASYYHNDMMESARSFRDGWFYSGDLGYLDPQGNLHLAGRTSAVINAGGVKINPHDVEQKVMTLDGISACAGVEVAGPSGVNVFGLAVVGVGEVDLVRLEKLVKSYFPFGHPTVYKQVEELPRNQNGKTDKAALKTMFEQLS
jgi:acyl-coenzyme A synthetase/AMP-(fatty) acid ligase